MVVVIQFALGYAIVTGPRLQRHQEGGRGPQDLRRRGAAAATRRAAATAQGHAEGAAAADDCRRRWCRWRRRRRRSQTVTAPPPVTFRRSRRRRRRRRRRRARSQSAQSAKGDLRTSVQHGRLSGIGASRGRRRHRAGAADHRARRPRGRLQPGPFDGQRRARFRDLQHSAPSREVHVRRATATAMRRRTRSRRRRSCGGSKANTTRIIRDSISEGKHRHASSTRRKPRTHTA